LLHRSSTFCVAAARGKGVVSRSLASEFRLQYEISRWYSVMTGCWTALSALRCSVRYSSLPLRALLRTYRHARRAQPRLYRILRANGRVDRRVKTLLLSSSAIGVFTFANMTAAAVQLIFGSFLLNSAAALLPLPISDFYPSDESTKRNHRLWLIFILLFFYNQ